MTSLLCVKTVNGDIEVHNKEIAADFTSDANAQPLTVTSRPLTMTVCSKRPQSTQSSMVHPKPIADGSSSDSEIFNLHGWISSKQLKELQRKSFDENTLHRTCSSLLETEDTFVKDIGHFLAYNNMYAIRKKELLHKKWINQVYRPIRQEILQAMIGQDWREVNRRRRQLFRQYLWHVNCKGHVFLDTMDKKEYYAQALHDCRPSPIVARTATLRDPLLKQHRERTREDRILLRCASGRSYSLRDVNQIQSPILPLLSRGRYGTTCNTWLEMPLGNILCRSAKQHQICLAVGMNEIMWGRS